jgi:hypothetical protein
MSNEQTGIRPILAPHRVEGYSTIIDEMQTPLDRLDRGGPQATSASAVRNLVDALRGPGDFRSPLTPPTPPLVEATRTFRSRSEHLQSIATSVVNAGGTLVDFRARIAALPPDHDVSKHLRDKGSASRGKAIVRSFVQAERWVTKNPTRYGGIINDADVIAGWRTRDLDLLPGPMGRAIPALLKAAETNGSRLIGTSTRHLAELSGCSEAPARRALIWARERAGIDRC